MLNELEQRILTLLQHGIDPVERPFSPIAETCGISETMLLDTLKRLQSEGIIRRIGGVFNAASLGYHSTLAALDVPAAEVDAVAAKLQSHPGITHSYLRAGSPNLWITLTAHHDDFDNEKTNLVQMGGYPILWLPAIRKYKVQVIFDFTDDVKKNNTAPTQPLQPLKFTVQDKKLIRRLQSDLPLVADPWQAIADDTAIPTKEILETVAHWLELGALRRIAVILRHRKTGIQGNAMALWDVDPADADRYGALLSERTEVSHCYLREMPDTIPGNLYAMLHAPTMAEVEKVFAEISETLQLPKGQLFQSVKEYKKTSPQFFIGLQHE